jgi:hypothetical protein
LSKNTELSLGPLLLQYFQLFSWVIVFVVKLWESAKLLETLAEGCVLAQELLVTGSVF